MVLVLLPPDSKEWCVCVALSPEPQAAVAAVDSALTRADSGGGVTVESFDDASLLAVWRSLPAPDVLSASAVCVRWRRLLNPHFWSSLADERRPFLASMPQLSPPKLLARATVLDTELQAAWRGARVASRRYIVSPVPSTLAYEARVTSLVSCIAAPFVLVCPPGAAALFVVDLRCGASGASGNLQSARMGSVTLRFPQPASFVSSPCLAHPFVAASLDGVATAWLIPCGAGVGCEEPTPLSARVSGSATPAHVSPLRSMANTPPPSPRRHPAPAAPLGACVATSLRLCEGLSRGGAPTALLATAHACGSVAVWRISGGGAHHRFADGGAPVSRLVARISPASLLPSSSSDKNAAGGGSCVPTCVAWSGGSVVVGDTWGGVCAWLPPVSLSTGEPDSPHTAPPPPPPLLPSSCAADHPHVDGGAPLPAAVVASPAAHAACAVRRVLPPSGGAVMQLCVPPCGSGSAPRQRQPHAAARSLLVLRRCSTPSAASSSSSPPSSAHRGGAAAVDAALARLASSSSSSSASASTLPLLRSAHAPSSFGGLAPSPPCVDFSSPPPPSHELLRLSAPSTAPASALACDWRRAVWWGVTCALPSASSPAAAATPGPTAAAGEWTASLALPDGTLFVLRASDGLLLRRMAHPEQAAVAEATAAAAAAATAAAEEAAAAAAAAHPLSPSTPPPFRATSPPQQRQTHRHHGHHAFAAASAAAAAAAAAHAPPRASAAVSLAAQHLLTSAALRAVVVWCGPADAQPQLLRRGDCDGEGLDAEEAARRRVAWLPSHPHSSGEALISVALSRGCVSVTAHAALASPALCACGLLAEKATSGGRVMWRCARVLPGGRRRCAYVERLD